MLKNQVHALESTVLKLRSENLKLKLGIGKNTADHTQLTLKENVGKMKDELYKRDEQVRILKEDLSKVKHELDKTCKWSRSSDALSWLQEHHSSIIRGLDFGNPTPKWDPKSKYLTLPENKICAHCGKTGHYKSKCTAKEKKDEIIGVVKEGKTDSHYIENVYLIDGLKYSLISISQLCDRDNKLTCLSVLDNDPLLWHKRLGHASLSQLNKLVSEDLVIGLPNIKFKKDKVCEACAREKQVRSSFKSKKVVSTTRTMELVHMDLCGPMRTLSRGGKRYVMVLVDDYSRFTWTLFLTSKDEAYDMFTSFVRKTQKQLGNQLASIRSDHGRNTMMKQLGWQETQMKPQPRLKLHHRKEQDAYWVNAMQDELNQFERSQVWHLVPRPKDRSVIETKWVFKNKLDEEGEVTRNKARLVVQGYSQEEGIDYNEIFAPVSRLEAIRLLIAFATYMEFTLHPMDVKSAFLNGYLKEEVFVKQPPGFERKECLDHVYKIYKIYVDDIIFGATANKLSKKVAKLMGSEFEMSMMGELNFFLGLPIKQNSNGTMIHQQKYVKESIKRFKMEDSKEIDTHIATATKLDVDEPGSSVDYKLYRGMIGSLLYLTASRPGIIFSVCL
ncbi:uncharacterized protein [Nicotiana tomentosiformis]|uniref:uncharacterized protein n=1 Tax=Nicotiana tomentosiformis TaxID=4098 RepID=UPI00388C742E